MGGGIPTSQKAYDEGYFVLDSQGRLLHVKMTNGKPFVKDTKAGETINVSCMFPMDIENKSLYGFLFDTNHTLYYLSTDGYELVKVLENVDPDKDRVSIMANMFFWTVVKESADGEYTYALKNENMQQVDSLFRPARQSQWDKTLPYLFPFTVNFQDSTNSYVYPRDFRILFPLFRDKYYPDIAYLCPLSQRKILREISSKYNHAVHGICRVYNRMYFSSLEEITLII